jgi:uncharacterized membrane-anchored protein YhcB (DUF1043 family)
MDFNLITILALALALVIGIFAGFTMSRHSKKGNALYDEAVARADRAEEQLREWRASLKNKG